jgi:gliding motility-associated-like protein
VAATICEGEFYELPDGGFASSTGSYPILLSTVNGCDSLVTTALTVNPVYDVTIPISLCDDEEIVLPDGSTITDPDAGLYSFTFSSVDGCDSIVSIVLTILPIYDLTDTVVICEGDSYVLPDGTSVSAAGDYTSSFLTAAGCDSVMNTTIIANELFTTLLEPSICDDEFYELPDGGFTATSGTYEFTLTDVNGCDSVVTVDLTVYPTYTTSFSASICAGDDYVLPDGTTLIAPDAGSYPVTLTSIDECDSIVTVNLSLWPVYDIIISEEICEGTTFLLPDGSSTGVAGDYVFSYNTINGCDSTVTIALTVNPLPVPVIDIVDDGYCIDAGTQTLLATPVGGTWSGSGVSGSSFNPTTVGVGGPYFINYTYTDINGCTDSTFITLDVYPLPEPELVLPPYACLDADAVPLVGLPDGGFFSGAGLMGDDFIPNLTGTGTGFVITYTFTDGNSCTNSVNGSLDVLENIVDAGTDTSLFIGDTILLGFGTEGDIEWTPINSISCADCPVLYFYPTATTTYTITETDPNGCVATDQFTVWVRTEPNADIFAPTAFTPNGDGANDYFLIYGQDIVNILNLSIFDRWGELIYQNQNIAPGDEQAGWDGFFLGNNAATGVYAFIAEIELKGGTVVVSKGNVTLLR